MRERSLAQRERKNKVWMHGMAADGTKVCDSLTVLAGKFTHVAAYQTQ